MIDRRPAHPKERAGVEAWIPDYGKFGYSRGEAEGIARIAERLWIRYTAENLTIDSAEPTGMALDALEVLVQALCLFGLRDVSEDELPPSTRQVHGNVAPSWRRLTPGPYARTRVLRRYGRTELTKVK